MPAADAEAVREAIEETIRDGTVTERDGTWLLLSLRAARLKAADDAELEQLLDGLIEELSGALAYYVVAEALTDVAKYSQASKEIVRIAPVGECLIVDVEDDGVGGADASAGTGLRGLADRVAARDGVFTIESEPGSGTHVHAEIPLS